MCASSCSKNAKSAYSQPPKLNQSQVSRKSESYKGEHRHCSRSELRRTNNSAETHCCGCTDKQAIKAHDYNREEHLIELFVHQIGDFQSNRLTKPKSGIPLPAAPATRGRAERVQHVRLRPPLERRQRDGDRWEQWGGDRTEHVRSAEEV
jgi:hypothetical protein